MFSLLWVKVAIGAVAVIGLLQLQHWWTTRDLRRDLAKQEQLLKTTQEEAAKASAEAARNAEREEANRKDQQAAIDQQNARIRNMAATVRQAEAAATIAAMRVLTESRTAADALLDASSPVPVGYEALNDWQAQWKQRIEEEK